MKKAKFNLHSWTSNSPSLATQDVTAGKNTTVNILGIQWTPHNDLLHLAPAKLTNASNLITKWEVLQQSCKVFDPISIGTLLYLEQKY